MKTDVWEHTPPPDYLEDAEIQSKGLGWMTEEIKRFRRQAERETHSAHETRGDLTKVYDAFQIGSAVRTPQTLLANVENSKRRSDCLSAIEREFFTYVVADEDGEDMERCDLSWGADPAEYVEQFRAALSKPISPQKASVAQHDCQCATYCMVAVGAKFDPPVKCRGLRPTREKVKCQHGNDPAHCIYQECNTLNGEAPHE